jgi:hypothetical protein
MPAVPARPYVIAGAALAAASLVAVTPLAPRLPELPVVSMATRLVDADSILNVPINLFDDIVNIPYNEVQAIDSFAESLLFSGTWADFSSANLWGEDPGDPGHFEAVVNMLVPFPALSGMGAGEYDWTAGLGQQLVGLLNAELPVSASCDAETCMPITPTSPITGSTGLDPDLWLAEILTGQEKFPLIDNWFQVPLSQLESGYTFGPNDPGYVDPSGPANSLYNLLGTQTVDGQNLMPWDTAVTGTTYQLNLSGPFDNFFNSLMAPPSTDGILGTGIELPTGTEFTQALQALLASVVVAFDYYTPGSPFCSGDCSIITDLNLNYPQLVQDISNASPGNPIIDQWLTAFQDGTANVPTEAQILDSIQNLQQGSWDFGNPSPNPDLSVGFDPSTLAPFFQTLWTDLGLYQPAAASSGLDLSTLSTDLTSLLDLGGASDLSSQLSTDLSTLLANLSTLPMDLLSSF